MNRFGWRRSLRWALLLGSVVASCQDAPRAGVASSRPNLLVILSDDMGYSDLGCYGGEIRTPNLDRLAQHGVRFTQFYNTARCCPTRASLLTGLYAHQAGVGHMTEDWGHDGYQGDLGPHAVTIAEVLRPAGYRTYAVGKWHVTKHVEPDGPKDNWPLQRGFDRFYGTIAGGGSYYDPGTLTRDNQAISPMADPEYRPERFYYTDAITDHSIRFLREHRAAQADRPFFLYVAYTAAHWPMHALPEDISKYQGKYDAGYDAVRKARFARMKEMGLLDPVWRLSPLAGDWETETHKVWEARCMEVYAAMVDRMDQGIGRIVESLRENGQLENTLLLFLQDNGGCAEATGRSPDQDRPAAPSFPAIAAGTLRQDVIPKQTREGWPVLHGRRVMPGPPDTFIAYGRSWANVSNTPFREYKHWEHEGGVSTPLIAHWPAGIPAARNGALERQPGHLIDLMPTAVDLAASGYPRERAGVPVHPQEGVSLRPAFLGNPLGRPRPIFWEHEGNRAIRDGKWKLVSKFPGGWELYDMEADRTELDDLSAHEPDRARALAVAWEEWAKRVGVESWPVRRAKKSP
jgi:arylsulfatase A-like enzyme